MFKQKTFDQHVNIDDIKPLIDAQGLFFPLKVENGTVEEDGLSFGLPVDSGRYAIVTYEKAVGVMAEDTVALMQQKMDQKVMRFDLRDFLEPKQLKNWAANLAEPLADPHDYHSWTASQQNTYDTLHSCSPSKLKDHLILSFQGQQLFKKDGEYFARVGEHWHMGDTKLVALVDDLTEEMLLDIVQVKKQIYEQENVRINQVSHNLKQLSKVFGYKADMAA